METVSKISKIEKIFKLTFIIILGSILIAISAKIKIPFYPVPMTMQTFVILLVGITLGYKIGLATVALYLFEGIMGLPVFASSPEKGIGWVYFTGPTMGYLIGFLVATYISGKFKYKDFFKNSSLKDFFSNYIKLLFSVSFIYIFGLLWLGTLIGWDKPIFEFGAKPFLLAESFKILLLTVISGKIVIFRKFI